MQSAGEYLPVGVLFSLAIDYDGEYQTHVGYGYWPPPPWKVNDTNQFIQTIVDSQLMDYDGWRTKLIRWGAADFIYSNEFPALYIYSCTHLVEIQSLTSWSTYFGDESVLNQCNIPIYSFISVREKRYRPISVRDICFMTTESVQQTAPATEVHPS